MARYSEPLHLSRFLTRCYSHPELCHAALHLRLAQFPHWKRRLMRRFMFSGLVRRIVARRARKKEKHRFGDFEIEYVFDGEDEFDFGVNYIGLELTSVFSTKQYADLGDGTLHLPDVDFYSFTGKQNEKVSVRLQADPQAGGQGKRAGLILYSQDPGARLFRADMGRLPNQVKAVLPADGRYVIGIIGGSGRQSYKGAYCVTLTASYETSATLEPFWQNE